MRVEGLEHFNIVAADIGRTVAFYEKLLGLDAREIPVAPKGYPGRWIYDGNDQPIIHVQVHDPERHGALDEARATTGAIDHVALACTDFEDTRLRCEELGLDYRVNDVPKMNFRQIFVSDPDNVLLELNFRGG
ncbi:MAG: VOC family protein [Sphingomonadaceae bacterium]|nr:VOC family protein [Sphingomonadaceae bacterium]